MLYMAFLLSLHLFSGTFLSYLPVDFFSRNPFLLTENVSYPFLTDESKLPKYFTFHHFPLEAVTLI